MSQFHAVKDPVTSNQNTQKLIISQKTRCLLIPKNPGIQFQLSHKQNKNSNIISHSKSWNWHAAQVVNIVNFQIQKSLFHFCSKPIKTHEWVDAPAFLSFSGEITVWLSTWIQKTMFNKILDFPWWLLKHIKLISKSFLGSKLIKGEFLRGRYGGKNVREIFE